MLYRKNKTAKQTKLKKWIILIGLVLSLKGITFCDKQENKLFEEVNQLYTEQANELCAEHHAKATHPILNEIKALSFDKLQDVQIVIEHILNDASLDPLEILEHLEETGKKTNNKNINKMVSFVRSLIIELTKAQVKTESEAKKIILKIAIQEGALKLIEPVQKALSSLDKKTKEAKFDELEQRILKSKFYKKYFHINIIVAVKKLTT